MGALGALVLSASLLSVTADQGNHPLVAHGVHVSAVATVTILRSGTTAQQAEEGELQRLSRKGPGGRIMVEFY